MECPVTSAAGAACAAPAATALPPLCAGRGAASCALVRAPSYADMVRRPASPPAEAAPRPPPATADTALMGRPRVTLPFSQLTLGKTSPPWHAGSWRVHACRVDGDVLRVDYPRDSSNFDSGGPEGGCNFRARPRCLPATDVTLAYNVWFANSFEWGKGGKLPGLFVGYGDASGGERSATAASCRLMWQRGGRVVAYVYPPAGVKQPASYERAAERAGVKFGDKLFQAANLAVARDGWNSVIVRVKLNGFDADGKPVPDGVVTVSVNQQTATLEGMIWRRKPDVKVSHIMFSTFYGGKWRCPRSTYAEFKAVSCIT